MKFIMKIDIILKTFEMQKTTAIIIIDNLH